MFKKHSKAKSVGPRLHRYYWFTIVAANNQVLATSETYTTAAMRDKGIDAVKKVVKGEVAGDRIVKAIVSNKGEFRIGGNSRRPSDTFHLENKHGKITKG